MGIPVVIAASGGLPVVVAATGGLPMTIATNGFGIRVTQSTNGFGLPVTGITFGPSIVLTGNSVAENSAVNTVIGALSMSGTTGTPAYTLTDSAGGRFKLVGSSLQVAAATLDFETATSHNVIVSVTGVTPVVTATTFTIVVLNVSLVAPAAPTLTLTSANTDTTPDFTLAGDLVVGDTVRFQYSTSSGFAGASELTNTIDAAEDTANLITFTTGALALGTWYFRARIERPEAVNGDWSNVVTDTIIAGSYAGGPGNVVASARMWVGLRAYTTAYATGSNPALDLHNNTTGAFVATINILADGSLDVATAATIISGGASRIGKLYDQTGNGFHFVQATNTKRPVLALSGLGSLPVMTFDGVSQSLSNATPITAPQGATFSAVAKKLSGGAQQSLFNIHGSGGDQQLGYNNSGSGNQVFIYAGAVLGATASDGSWHAIQSVFNSTASNVNIDATSTAGDGGPEAPTGSTCDIGAAGGGTDQFLNGSIVEVGCWNATAFSGANCTAMSANQHTYWGF